ncbi:unnamed protein product [Leuciscus chuanchicus]
MRIVQIYKLLNDDLCEFGILKHKEFSQRAREGERDGLEESDNACSGDVNMKLVQSDGQKLKVKTTHTYTRKHNINTQNRNTRSDPINDTHTAVETLE